MLRWRRSEEPGERENGERGKWEIEPFALFTFCPFPQWGPAVSYTNVPNVAGMFPTFKRGITQQNPPDSLIQQYIDDVASEMNAIIDRRFAEAIAGPPSYDDVGDFVASLGIDGQNICEKINRYGAAAQLGETLATFGVSGARDLAKSFEGIYEQMMNDLDARNAQGRPMPAGAYDHLFDPSARTETPRPGLEGIAGGDQPRGQTARDIGLSNVFSKFDVDES
jgi:hypothetical protein